MAAIMAGQNSKEETGALVTSLFTVLEILGRGARSLSLRTLRTLCADSAVVRYWSAARAAVAPIANHAHHLYGGGPGHVLCLP